MMRRGGGVRAALGRLTAVDWAQLHAKAAGAGWAVVLFLLTPSVVAASIGSVFVWILTGFVLAGAAVSSTGLILAARTPEPNSEMLRADLRRSLHGLAIELVGIILMIVGLVLYFATQIVLAITLPTGIDRVALCVLIYFTVAQLVSRLVSVVRRRYKEAELARSLGGTT